MLGAARFGIVQCAARAVARWRRVVFRTDFPAEPRWPAEVAGGLRVGLVVPVSIRVSTHTVELALELGRNEQVHVARSDHEGADAVHSGPGLAEGNRPP